jgi:hypothetical protein
MRLGLPALACLGLALAACGSPAPTATPTAPPTPTFTPPPAPVPTLSPDQPPPGLCLPTGEHGVAAGESWEIAGPTLALGVDDETARISTRFTVLGFENGPWLANGQPMNAGLAVATVRAVTRRFDGVGRQIDSIEGRSPIPVVSALARGPLLTTDWPCHIAAWLQGNGAPGPAGTYRERTVEEQTLASGVETLVFTLSSTAMSPALVTSVESFGYDVATGRLVSLDRTEFGARDGGAYSFESIQALVETGALPTPTPDGSRPAWLGKLIATYESEAPASPPLSVSAYTYNEQTVYFVPQRCCNIYSDLYDAGGAIIAHPDGGIAGTGDGRASDFLLVGRFAGVVWSDPRADDGRRIEVPAPIERVRVVALGDGSGLGIRVVSALPDGCSRFERWSISGPEPGEAAIIIRVVNSVSTRQGVVCAQEFRTVESVVPLPAELEPGLTYTIRVNGLVISYP